MRSIRFLALVLAGSANLLAAGLARAVDPPLPPVIRDADHDGKPDMSAVRLAGGWKFSFAVDQSFGDLGISSFHVRQFNGGWKKGGLSGESMNGGGWVFSDYPATPTTPQTISFVLPPPPDAGRHGDFDFLVSGAGLPVRGADAQFEYRFDYNWQDNDGIVYNTEFLIDGKIVPESTHQVPEPTTAALMLAGLLVAAIWRVKSSRGAAG